MIMLFQGYFILSPSIFNEIIYFLNRIDIPRTKRNLCFALQMSFSSNGTLILCSKLEGEVAGSCPTGWVCNLPEKKNAYVLQWKV